MQPFSCGLSLVRNTKYQYAYIEITNKVSKWCINSSRQSVGLEVMEMLDVDIVRSGDYCPKEAPS